MILSVRERVPDNIIYKQEDIRAKYHEIFDKALEEYNTGKRADRKITDYYEHMLKSKKEKPFYEVVVQFGDIENCGFGQRNFEQAKQMLDEYMKEFEKRNPNMKVFNAVMHLDEATPHLHIDFLPVCHNQKQGLSTRISMKKALEEQGFISSSKRISEWAVWATAEKEIMTSILKRHGLSRDVKNAHYAHMECEEYRQSRKELEKLRPQKTNPKKIYSFENDKEINHLSQQLLTMRDFNLNSRDDIYEAAERSQKKIDDTLAQIRKLTEDMPTLKSDIAQLKFYFSARQNNSDAMNQVRLDGRQLIDWEKHTNVYNHLESLTPAEAEILSKYRNLNIEGQKRITEYADDLVAGGRFAK